MRFVISGDTGDKRPPTRIVIALGDGACSRRELPQPPISPTLPYTIQL